MKKSIISKAILGAIFATAAFAATGSAMAQTACVYTEWSNVEAGHALPTITSRVCGDDMAVNVIGADPSGQTFDFGWSESTRLGPDSFSAVFVDANASNKIQLNILPVLNSMHAIIETTLTGGATTNWTADYVLSKTY
ncbi:MAG: hypothetical protein L3J13_07145 [Devosiaceae bacterium]|nr:hypothetical protein [Devosiaceae bacterium]